MDADDRVDEGAELVEPAVESVRRWLDAAPTHERRRDRRSTAQLRALTADPASTEFAMAFLDRVMRPESVTVAAGELRSVVARGVPPFLGPVDAALLRAGAALAPAIPGIVVPLARRRLRRLVGGLVVDRDPATLRRRLRDLDDEGFAVNANLLGEAVLGEDEAVRRRDEIVALIAGGDVRCVSVKPSAVASQLHLWDHEGSVGRVEARLRPVLRAAAATTPPTFVNLDMEEYKDLRLTLDVFTGLLDEPELRGLEAGLALQAYLPDSSAALDEVTRWAKRRVARGGAPVKVRVVKGANLAMERVDAAMHGWAQAPFTTKDDVDAHYKRMLDAALHPDRTRAVRVGVASHNLFDVAWALHLAERRRVADAVTVEMLQGMAPSLARTVRTEFEPLLLYTPVVAPGDFDAALTYLFRRLEENAGGENFLRHLFELRGDAAAFDAERLRFERAVRRRLGDVDVTPRRHRPAVAPDDFANAPDTDPTDATRRDAIVQSVATMGRAELPPEVDAAGIDGAVAAALAAQPAWRSMARGERRALLRRVADELEARRPDLVAVMAQEAQKTVGEGDVEVSEAVDFARYYAEHVDPTAPGARFEPFGVVVVAPPWNFPLAIALGGALAALAAGNTVIVKPAPETPRTALAGVEACWAAGVPRDALQVVRSPDGPAGERLVGHPDVGGIVLTGSTETAELFGRIAPATPLCAETSGKNALVVMPDADLDLAVADLVRSAFGHAGQKCSAASLAILVGDVATSARFRRQLVDATRSLVVGPADDPASVVGPLIGPPGDKLRRALTEPSPGERWLVEPRCLDEASHLWSPGILDGVAAGSWFHRTECFGPVLGLMAARDLDEAIEWQNDTGFGLTGGIHTLDGRVADRWIERVEVGNAYVNRGITGAIVRRQPFGGWKGSVVGPGAKAGGPNYVAQLGRWSDDDGAGGEPDAGAPTDDAAWWREHFALDHDPSGLFCESNVFRYRPLDEVVVRVGPGTPQQHLDRVLAAVGVVGARLQLSASPSGGWKLPAGARREDARRFWTGVAEDPPERVRLLGGEVAGPRPPATTFVDDRVPVRCGRIELLRYVREQSVSRTLHRYGNVVNRSRRGRP